MTPTEDISSITEQTFRRRENRTHVTETFWTFLGMRSLHASYNDGLHSVSFITHKDNPDRQTTIGIHTTASFSIDPDDSIALQMNIVSEDGTPANVGIFGITLEQLSDAVSTALQEKHASKSEPA